VTSVDASPNAVKSTRRFNPNTHQMRGFVHGRGKPLENPRKIVI
jgi:ribosomal protein L28